MEILIIPDSHSRSFFHKVFKVTDKPVIFLGDETDPYIYEGFTDEDGVDNLKKIIEYKKSRPKDVTLLVGNHAESFIWSFMGFERTDMEYYKELHKIYRDNIKLFEPCKLIDDTLFTHAGVSHGWLNGRNLSFERNNSQFRLNKDTIVPYIQNEFNLELERDKALQHGWHACLESPIFDIGFARGGHGYGGPFWNDFNDEFTNPEWDLWQVFGHTQCRQTGLIRQKYHSFCLDSRTVFEYDTETHEMHLSDLTENYENVKARLDALTYEE